MIRKHMTYENTYRDDTRALDRKQNLPTRKKLTDSYNSYTPVTA